MGAPVVRVLLVEDESARFDVYRDVVAELTHSTMQLELHEVCFEFDMTPYHHTTASAQEVLNKLLEARVPTILLLDLNLEAMLPKVPVVQNFQLQLESGKGYDDLTKFRIMPGLAVAMAAHHAYVDRKQEGLLVAIASVYNVELDGFLKELAGASPLERVGDGIHCIRPTTVVCRGGPLSTKSAVHQRLQPLVTTWLAQFRPKTGLRELGGSKWAEMREVLWEAGAEPTGAFRQAHRSIRHPYWAHHLPDGGDPHVESGLTVPAFKAFKDVLGSRLPSVSLERLRTDQTKWEPGLIPWRAVCQFDGRANDLLSAFSCWNQQARTTPTRELIVALRNLVTTEDKPNFGNCLWCNGMRIAETMLDLVADFEGRSLEVGLRNPLAAICAELDNNDDRGWLRLTLGQWHLANGAWKVDPVPQLEQAVGKLKENLKILQECGGHLTYPDGQLLVEYFATIEKPQKHMRRWSLEYPW